MESLFDLTGKVAIVTGASSGLGIQFANALAKQGASVAIVARNYDRLMEVKDQIKSTGRECLAIRCDVTIEGEIEKTVNTVLNEFGKIDILVNNAGVIVRKEAENLTEEEWDRVINTNLKGVFLFSKHVAKHMISRKYGKIINTASMYGKVGNLLTTVVPYHASKGGVVNLTRALAAEWAKYGITVNAIGPAYFKTELTKEKLKDDSFMNFIKFRCPMQRIGEPGELDGALVYFASDASSYTTGQTLYVDGGWTSV